MLRTVILCLGDSLTYGARDNPEGYGYPARLEELVARETGNPCLCINKGISRENSTDIARRAYDTIRGYPEVQLLLVLAGTNDLKGGPNEEVYRRNMLHILVSGKANGKKVLFGTLPPIMTMGMWCFPKHVQDYIDRYNDMLIGSCVQLVKFDDMGKYLVDGVHFGPEGYAEMARRWMEGIKTLL